MDHHTAWQSFNPTANYCSPNLKEINFANHVFVISTPISARSGWGLWEAAGEKSQHWIKTVCDTFVQICVNCVTKVVCMISINPQNVRKSHVSSVMISLTAQLMNTSRGISRTNIWYKELAASAFRKFLKLITQITLCFVHQLAKALSVNYELISRTVWV